MSETSIRAQFKYKTLSEVTAKCRAAGLSGLGSKDAMIERLVQHEMKKTRGSSSSSISGGNSSSSSKPTEASVRAKFTSLTLMQVHSECTKAGVSTYGTKEQMIARLVAKQKPPSGWGTSASSSVSSPSRSSGQTEGQVKGKYLAMTLMQVRMECTKKNVSQLGTKDQMIARLVAKEKPAGGWPSSSTSSTSSPYRSPSSSYSSASSSPTKTESEVRKKYSAMTLMAVRQECTKKALSTFGTKEQMVARLVLKDKPAAGWARESSSSSSSSSYSSSSTSPARSAPKEADVKRKYQAMTLMEVRRACTQKGMSQMGTKEQLIQKLTDKEKPAGGWGSGASSASSASPSRASTGPTEGQVKGKYLAMTLMEVRRECTRKGLSQMGTKDQLVAKLVEKDKPPGGWGGSGSTSSSTTRSSVGSSSSSSGRKQYKIKLAAKVRAGFEATSQDLGVAHVGEIITEIDSRVNAKGITRVHYDRGWLSMKTADGRTILEPHYSPSSQSTGVSSTGASTGVSAQKAEALAKGKYLAMTLMQTRNACSSKGLSQMGTKDDMVRRLVQSDKPPGGWGSSGSAAASSTSYGSSSAAADAAVSRLVASESAWDKSDDVAGGANRDDYRSTTAQPRPDASQSARRVVHEEPEPQGPIIGDAFSRARDAATLARRKRGPSGWEEEVVEVMNSSSAFLPTGLAAELLHALEFASLPLDGWLDGEDEEADWNSAQAVLHDLPCSTGGLVAVRLLRNLCRARATFCECVLDEGGRVWHVLLPFLCWCSFQHPRAETVGTAPAKDDGRLWATQLLEALALVGAEVVGSLTWVYFWLTEVLERAMSTADLRLTAAAVGLLRNLMLDSTNCRRVFAMPQGQPFIAQLLPAALNVLTPLGLLRFGDTARHLGRAQNPHTPRGFDAAEHPGGKLAVDAVEATDRLAKVAESLSERIDWRRERLRDDYRSALQQKQKQQADDDKSGSAAVGAPVGMFSDEDLQKIEDQDGELRELRSELADAQQAYRVGRYGDAGIELTVQLATKPAPPGQVSAKILYDGTSIPATAGDDGIISLPIGAGVEGGGLPIGGITPAIAWQGGVAAAAVEENFSPKQPVPVMILEVVERWSEVGGPYLVDCRTPGCGCTQGLHNATVANPCCTLAVLLQLLDARRLPAAVPTLLRRGLTIGAHRALAVLLTDVGPRAMHALLMQLDPKASAVELGASAPKTWAQMTEGVAFGRPSNAPKPTATMLNSFKDGAKAECHDDWKEHYDWLRTAITDGTKEFQNAAAAVLWEVISLQSEHYADDGGYSLEGPGGSGSGKGGSNMAFSGIEEGAVDYPRPSPALDTLIALSSDVCYSCKMKELQIGHELLKPADCPPDTELLDENGRTKKHGQPDEERVVRHGDGEDAEIQRCVYNAVTRQWDRVCAAPLCWKLFLRGKSTTKPPPEAAYREVRVSCAHSSAAA
eukprot:COSAG06_NODE_115_length_23358_cov_31.775227_3_plen_1442_part_00